MGLKFRRISEDVEAIQYRPGDGGNCKEVARFLGMRPMCNGDCEGDIPFFFQTPDGQREAEPGFWIIRGASGFRSLDPEDFQKNYEQIS